MPNAGQRIATWVAESGGLVPPLWGWLSTEADVRCCCCFTSQARVSALARFFASDGDHPGFWGFYGAVTRSETAVLPMLPLSHV